MKLIRCTCPRCKAHDRALPDDGYQLTFPPPAIDGEVPKRESGESVTGER
jgi:hypothetical protein